MIKATLQKKKMDGFVDLSVCVCVHTINELLAVYGLGCHYLITVLVLVKFESCNFTTTTNCATPLRRYWWHNFSYVWLDAAPADAHRNVRHNKSYVTLPPASNSHFQDQTIPAQNTLWQQSFLLSLLYSSSPAEPWYVVIIVFHSSCWCTVIVSVIIMCIVIKIIKWVYYSYSMSFV